MEWKECRNIKTETTAMPKVELNEALCRFVLEIRKKDGSEYPPNTVHHNYLLWHYELLAHRRSATDQLLLRRLIQPFQRSP